ncbi:putative adipose-regulatory protein-domain-containing protein [Lentinula aciculospora]|uniref:Adipose-regulatory protein-domain-containing protein n=1 Tax=Lentinula aciculospora TaxID=153920 RepID=A0A9W9DTK0_9AGAR|nr:putative adipose-regulatory protein-domain-containing protein [Lentinula aciculospora]
MRSLQISATGTDTDRLTLGVSNLQVSLMDAESAEKERISVGFWSSLLQTPFDFVSHYFRRYTPNLVSLSVFLLFIPFLCALSLSAGVLVWRNVAVGWQMPLYLQYGDGGQPYAHAILADLYSRQPYDIVLQLVVPSTDSNFALGNFMNSLTLSTINNKTLATVRRPAIAILPKTSYFSSKSHLVTLEIPMLDSFVPRTKEAVVDVKIGRQDAWKDIGNGEGRELSVYSASLKGILAHKGVRGLVTRFPTIFSLLCSVIFFAILFSILAACLLPSILRSSNDINETTQPTDDSEQKPSTLLANYRQYPGDSSDTETDASDLQEEKESKPSKSARRRKRRSAKNKNASEVSSVKSESDPVIIPSDRPSDPSQSIDPLRRRRSSKPLDVES